MTTLEWHLPIIDATLAMPATLVAGHRGAGAHQLAQDLAVKFCGGDTRHISHLTAVKKGDSGKEWIMSQHSDIMIVHPDNNVIAINATREIIHFCSLSPMALERRAAVILQAECMNTAAANALLKTLEEPATDKLLILSVHAVNLLPPTIISRCRIINTPMPNREQALAWLQKKDINPQALAFCGGLPLIAENIDIDKINDAITFFKRGKNINVPAAAKTFIHFEGWLDCLQKWITDGCRAAVGLPARYFPGEEKHQTTLCDNPERWFNYHAYLSQKRRLLSHPLAADLFIKEILYDYRKIFID